MNRNEFLIRASIGSAGIVLMPAFLSSCQKEYELPSTKWNGKVGIIGGGAAGMRAAHYLKKSGISYTLYEASSVLGGRMKALENFAEKPIELGAEFIQGQKSPFYDLAESTGVSFTNANHIELKEMMVLDGVLRNDEELEDDEDLLKVEKFVKKTLYNYEGSDMTIEQYADQHPEELPLRVRHVLNAETASAAGTSIDKLAIVSLAKQEDEWTAGNKSFLLNSQSMVSILKNAYADALTAENVKLRWPVVKIDSSGDKIILENNDGEVEQVDKLIITCSLAVLRDNVIAFTPELPSWKTSAFQKIGMDSGMKIIMKFTEKFWPDDLGMGVGEGKVPEFWTPYKTSKVLTLWIMGKYGSDMTALGDQAVATALDELDKIFGEGTASSKLEDYHIQDWGSEPYVRGVYSFPTPDMGDARQQLAKPVDDKLFFAGEATHFEGHSATVHGAMESANRAVYELLNVVNG